MKGVVVDDQELAVKEEVLEPTESATEEVQEPVESEANEPNEAQDETAQESEDSSEDSEEQKPQKRDAQGRIRQLVAERKKVQAERDRYAELLQNAANSPLPEELSPDEYRALTFNAKELESRLQNLEAELQYGRLQADSERIYQEFPELKDNPDLDNALTDQWMQDYAQLDQNGNIVGYRKPPSEFVKQQMKLLKAAKMEATAQRLKSIERQKSEGVITPETTAKSAPKDPSEMSTKDLEKTLGIVYQ